MSRKGKLHSLSRGLAVLCHCVPCGIVLTYLDAHKMVGEDKEKLGILQHYFEKDRDMEPDSHNDSDGI